jgi:hypothetical protein
VLPVYFLLKRPKRGGQNQRQKESPHRDVTYHTTADNIDPEKLVKEEEMKTTSRLILCLAKLGDLVVLLESVDLKSRHKILPSQSATG